MSYTTETLLKAEEILKERRSIAQNTYNARHTEITGKIPSIIKYEAELSKTGLAVIKALGMGEDSVKYVEDLSQINLKVQKCIKEELVKNGYPEDYLQVPYTCKECEDTGYISGVSCACRKKLLGKLNVEELKKVSPADKCRFDNFSLDYYPAEADPALGVSPRECIAGIYEYCKMYAADFSTSSTSLFLNGSTGLGKTHLSLAIANVAAIKGYNVLYYTAQNLFSALKNEEFTYGSSKDYEQKVLNCDLLIIDDLGSELITKFSVAAFYNIINTRINLSKPTIISTNLNGAEFEEKYTQRITSRIIGSFTNLRFIGKDIRQIKNTEF